MYILLDRKQENIDFVCYKFSTKIPTESYCDDGFAHYTIEQKEGVCIFNKKTYEINLDPQRTPAYFFEHDRARLSMFVVLLRCAKIPEYPEVIAYASG